MRRLTTILIATFAIVAGPSAAVASGRPHAVRGPAKSVTITLMTHDSFAVSKSVLRAFTQRTGIHVKILASGDAGQALNKAILTKRHPLADAFFGVDNTFLSRAQQSGIFASYRAAAVDHIAPRFRLDPTHVLTPIDYGDVCVNYDKRYFTSHHVDPPSTLDDLLGAKYHGLLVVENPATSSTGLAFLLATIARYGTTRWSSYWKQLLANDTKVDDGWEQAYNTDFSGSAGKGPRPLVVSYGSSPPAEVYFATPPPADAPTGVMAASCFRQVEFAGVLRGTKHTSAARSLIDFLVSRRFQEDVPLQMFVYPVLNGARLPDVFTCDAVVPAKPLSLAPGTIGSHRDAWLRAWTSLYRG